MKKKPNTNHLVVQINTRHIIHKDLKKTIPRKTKHKKKEDDTFE